MSFRYKFMSLGMGFFFLLFICFLGSCTGTLSGGPVPPIPDPCFEGIFSDSQITLGIVESSGIVTAVGWKEPGFLAPWESLSFNGSISTRGEATGDFSIHFPPETDSDGDVILRVITTPDFLFLIPNGGMCEARNILNLSLRDYEFDGISHTDLRDRSLTRQP